MDRIKKFLFSNRSLRQTAAKNTVWIAIGNITTKVIRVGIIIYAARLIGTESYGVFTYAMSVAGMFGIFSDLGISGIVTRELSKEQYPKQQYLATALAIKFGLLAIVFASAALFGPLISHFREAVPLLIVISITIIAESLRGFFYAITRAQNNMQVEAGLSIITEVICTVVVAIIFFAHPSAFTLALSYAIGNTIGTLITYGVIRKSLAAIGSFFTYMIVKPLVRSSLPFAIMSVFGIFTSNIDSIIIGLFGNAHLLGLYAAAQKPISVLYILPGFLSLGLFPIISKLVGSDQRSKLSLILEKSTVASFALALPIVAGGIILAGPIISATYGSAFTGAVTTFKVLIPIILFIFPGSLYADVLLAEDRQRLFIRSSIGGAILNVCFDLLLIPRMGIVGSAVATFIAQLFMNGIFLFDVMRHYPFRFMQWSEVIRLLAATFLMSGATIALASFSVPLLVIVPIAAAIYIGMLVVTKEPLIKDILGSFRD